MTPRFTLPDKWVTYPAARLIRQNEVLEETRLSHVQITDKYLAQISGSQQQRVA